MKNNLKKILFAGIISFFLGYFAYAYEVGTDFTLCTSTVDQPSCYETLYPSPTLNWTVSGASTQVSYWAQIDDNSNFLSNEINTGEVSSANDSYTVGGVALSFNEDYYWRIKIKDNFGSWIDDWVEAGTTFTTSPSCLEDQSSGGFSVTGVRSETYCVSEGTGAHTFSWTYEDPGGNPQSRFIFQVDDNADFSSPEINRDYTGLSNPSPSENNQTAYVVISPTSDKLVYDEFYYWRVKSYNSLDEDLGWDSGPSFLTGDHAFPFVDFSWSPANVIEGETTDFTDESIVYGGTTKTNWAWTFEDGVPASSTNQNPSMYFSSNGIKSVLLGVTDSDGYFCEGAGPASGGIGVKVALPDWKEISP